MDANQDSLEKRLRAVLGKAPDRVVSFTFTGGCFREEVYASHAVVAASMDMVSREIKEAEEEIEWIRGEKVRAMMKVTRMGEWEKVKVKELEETREKMKGLKEKAESMWGLVAKHGESGKLEVITACGCEGPCGCIRSLEVCFQDQEGKEKRVVLEAASMLGALEMVNKDVEVVESNEGPDECGDTQGEEVKDGNGNVVEVEKINMVDAVFQSQDVREKEKRERARAEVAKVDMEAREKVVEEGEKVIVAIVRRMERLTGERKFEEVMVEESRLWEETGKVLRASTGGKLKDSVYRRWFEGRLLQGQAAVVLSRMPALYQVVGCEKKPLKQVPMLGVGGLDEHHMSRWFLLRGIGRVEEGRYVEAIWDFSKAEEVARKHTRNMGRLGKLVGKESSQLKDWARAKQGQAELKDSEKGPVRFPHLQW